MKIFVSTIIGILFVSTLTRCSQELSVNKKKEIEATESIKGWLAIVDSGQYSKSWQLAGNTFKKQVSDSIWNAALNKVRTPLGKINIRTNNSAKYTTSLPGVPDGEYVIATFKTSFDKKKEALETVSAMFEDGKWRIVGYFIK
jgi:hypothetical protein